MGVQGERRIRVVVALGVLALVLGASGGVGLAEEPTPSGAPVIGLDKLMKLPDSYSAPAAERRGKGLTADQWRDRFAAADRDVVTAEKDLRNAQAALEKLAGSTSSWQMSAPGMLGGGTAGSDGETGPVSFRLREAVRMRKVAVEGAKRDRRELVVEANLAGVPDDWRTPIEEPKTPPAGAASAR